MAQAALVVLTRPEHCRCPTLYSQPASPGSMEREKPAFPFFPSLEVDCDTAYKIRCWCVLMPHW